MIPRSGLRVRPRGRCCQRSDHSVQPPSQQPRLTWGGGERPKGAAEPRLYTHLHSGRATAAVAATAAAARGAPEWGPWLSSPRDSEQVAAALAQGRSSAPLGEAWRQPRTPESRSGGRPCLPQIWAGARSQERGAKVAAVRAVSALLRPSARCCDDSRPVPSALASAPSPRSSPTAPAGSGGAAAGRALGREQ